MSTQLYINLIGSYVYMYIHMHIYILKVLLSSANTVGQEIIKKEKMRGLPSSFTLWRKHQLNT